MGEVIQYRKEFLPHVIRLFNPEAQRVDGQLSFFQQRFSYYRPAPEQSCLLLKGADKLLACAYLVPLEGAQPNLLYANVAADKALSPQDRNLFWEHCVGLANTMAPGPPILRIAVDSSTTPPEAWGFKVVREYVEMHAVLGDLPPGQEGEDAFHVVSLADSPHWQQSWLDIFNQGLTVFYDLQPMDVPCFQRLQSTPGYDGTAFRLGLEGETPVTALFYWVLDSDLGLVRINSPASPSGSRGRGFGRRMLKETLNYLEQKGLKEAILYTDAASQATNLLYKMLGFVAKGKVKIMECQVGAGKKSDKPTTAPTQQEAAPSSDSAMEHSFFTSAHSAFVPRKTKKPE